MSRLSWPARRIGLIAADVATCDRAALGGLVSGAQRLRGFLDAFDVRVAARVTELAAAGACEPADEVLANRGRRSRRDAGRAVAHAEASATVPGLETAMAHGKLSREHVDAIATCAARLNEAARAKLADHASDVIASASTLPVETFQREWLFSPFRGSGRRGDGVLALEVGGWPELGGPRFICPSGRSAVRIPKRTPPR